MINIKVGYIRVSSIDQNTARQEAMMKENVERLFVDKASGKNMERPQLKEMLGFVRKGDVLIVESISRLARNTRDLLTIIDELNKKEVQFISLKENINTSTPSGKFMLTVFGAISELERSYILQRQREGIEQAKLAGKYKGRKSIEIDDQFMNAYKLWKDGKITAAHAMKKAGVSKSTWYRKVKYINNEP